MTSISLAHRGSLKVPGLFDHDWLVRASATCWENEVERTISASDNNAVTGSSSQPSDKPSPNNEINRPSFEGYNAQLENRMQTYIQLGNPSS